MQPIPASDTVPTDAARLVHIEDPEDPRITAFVGLRDRELRLQEERSRGRRPSFFVAESDLVVGRALAAGYELEALLVDATRREPLPVGVPADATVFGAGPEVLRRITGLGMHRGSLGLFIRRPERTPGEVLDGARRVVVGETLVNPINLGVIARTAAALGMDGLLLDAPSADPLYRRASRVAMGEVFAFPWARIGGLPDGFAPLVERGFTLLALTPSEDAEDIGSLRPDPGERLALVLGSEGPGLTDASLAACHRRVRIPIAPTVDSLNVAAAAAIACWAVRPTDSPSGPG